MQAMLLRRQREPLGAAEIPRPAPGDGQVLLRVRACAVCRTDLHVLDGDLAHPKLPLILGHEIVGVVEEVGRKVQQWRAGDRLGVPWLGWSCGECAFCRAGRENLCDRARFTGYDIDGGYAEYAVADARFCFAIPDGYLDVHAAPLLCAGLIGYRALRVAGEARRVGLFGFGSAAHIVAQLATQEGRSVFAFTRPADEAGQRYALELGATWAGGSDVTPPEPLDAAIIFAPVGGLVPAALRSVAKGGTVVCAGIHMSDIPGFPYSILWGERVLRSVANLTRRDGEEFFRAATQAKLRIDVKAMPLGQANTALDALREGRGSRTAVLVP
jgi:propanol-preferring alcohol dehydrogenase